MDPIDALEDYLSRTHRQSSSSDCNIQRLLNVLQIPQSNLQARSTIFRSLLQMTPLQYAIDFSPMDVRTLLFSELSNGCTKGSNLQAEGPLLVYAIGAGNIGLIKPLVDAGVDVNQKYTNGETALHVICHRCYYACLREIVRWAGDKIDWGMCTPGGRNALELFEESVAAGRGKGLSKKQVDEFGAILKNHIGYERMELSEESRTSLSMPGAFPCNIVGLEA
ncbi:hypothetical protein BDY19DRAFT_992645 [Irpex rosettiformis]|uniref:Uncharacterized protein n=1 Tax=Irpex rosettiformis TaxID=378272 RepID=A0ACB8U805_9APHY|nr:hypothetical protein BDY19DRAFT_992645 [Irpex rosettiformis]